jgi:enhancing lycopene biosynthesis protein 2
MSTKKFAVVLSGCGVFDGAEIHEATLSLYAMAKNDALYDIFAPDIPQHHVINHVTGEEMNEERNVLVESARIARGKIQNLKEFDASYYDGILIPGGFGAAKNLSNWAYKAADAEIDPQVERCILDMVKAGKPIGALCIAPVILTKILGGVEITIGKDEDTSQGIEKAGGVHIEAHHGEIVIDKQFKVVSSPCYMLDATIVQIAEGAENVVKAMLELMND